VEAAKPVPLSRAATGEQLWVMKVPKFLTKLFDEKSTAGRSLGTVQPGAAASSSQATSYTLTLDSGALLEGIPREYEMNFSAPPPATYLLSHEEEQHALPGSSKSSAVVTTSSQLVGRVIGKGELRPLGLGDDYRGLVRERLELADKKARAVGLIDDDEVLKKPALSHKDTQRDEKRAKEKRGLQRELASTKRAKNASFTKKELKERVLELFGQQEYWGKPQLIAQIGSSEGVAKMLEELCVKIKQKGPHYSDFQLKPELSGRVAAGSSKARLEES